VHQVGTPWEIYNRPATRFVAGFVGAMNQHDPLPEEVAWQVEALAGHRPHIAGIRPEDVVLEVDGAADSEGLALAGVVAKISFAGREALYFVVTDGGTTFRVQVHRPTAALLARAGQPVRLRLPYADLLPYDEGGQLIAGTSA
jgi:ABC-type sugar transport system ATPase subunit